MRRRNVPCSPCSGGTSSGDCCGIKEKLRILWDRTIGSILRINGISPDGDGDFTSDRFCVFDIETTGLSAKDCKITEIGAVLYQGGKVLDTFSSFVNPHEALTEQISKIFKLH